MTWLEEERSRRDSLRADVGGLRAEAVGLRQEMQLGFARVDGTIEKALRKQTQFFFVAWAVILAAIVGIYAR